MKIYRLPTHANTICIIFIAKKVLSLFVFFYLTNMNLKKTVMIIIDDFTPKIHVQNVSSISLTKYVFTYCIKTTTLINLY